MKALLQRLWDWYWCYASDASFQLAVSDARARLVDYWVRLEAWERGMNGWKRLGVLVSSFWVIPTMLVFVSDVVDRYKWMERMRAEGNFHTLSLYPSFPSYVGETFGAFLVFAAVVPVILFSLGWGVAWVRRGFAKV